MPGVEVRVQHHKPLLVQLWASMMTPRTVPSLTRLWIHIHWLHIEARQVFMKLPVHLWQGSSVCCISAFLRIYWPFSSYSHMQVVEKGTDSNVVDGA